MKKLVTIIIVLFGIQSTNAQITLTAPDFIDGGDSVFYRLVGNYAADTGMPGANMTWDFSQIDTSTFVPDTTIALIPSTVPGGASFPNADFVINFIDNLPTFFEKSSTQIDLLGTYIDVRGFFTQAVVLNQPIPFITFPTTFNSTSSNSDTTPITVPFDTTIVLGGLTADVDSLRANFIITLASDPDGYGTFYLPNDTVQALRVRNTISVEVTLEVYNCISFIGITTCNWTPVPTSFLPVDLNTEIGNIRYWAKGRSLPILDITLDTASQPVSALYQFRAPFVNTKPLVKNPKFKVYPNPSSGEFTVEWRGSQPLNYQIWSALGKKVLEGKVNLGIAKIPTYALHTGNYVFVGIDSEGKTFQKRCTIIH